MGDVIGRDDEYLGPFGLPTAIRWGFPRRPLFVGYVWESVIPNHAPPLKEQMKVVQGCDIVYIEQITVESGEMSPRLQLQNMLDFLRVGDTVVVYNLCCLGTSAMEVIGYITRLLKVFRCNLRISGRINTSDPDTLVTVIEMCNGLTMAEVSKPLMQKGDALIRIPANNK
jgi:hypothetical protein